MNKDNKFYNYVENLIRDNNKIIGHENLVDTIMDDVFAKASVVLNTITDENVIEEFLKKTVSTSIITVIKRQSKDRNSSPKTSELIKKINNSKQVSDVKKEYIDNFINGYDVSNMQILQENESNINTEPEEIDSANDFNIFNKEIESFEKQYSDEAEDATAYNESADDIDYDVNVQDDIYEKTAEQFETDENYINDNIESEMELNSESDFENNFSSQMNDISGEEFIEIQNEVEESSAETDEQEEYKNDDFDSYEVVEITNSSEDDHSEIEQSEVINDFEILEEVSDDSLANFQQDELLNNSNYLELETFDDEQEELVSDTSSDNMNLIVSDVVSESTTINGNKSDFSIFEYTPVIPDVKVDTEMSTQIINRLSALDSQEPELNILKVYDLKYIQNKNINEIAIALDIDKEAVINALNKMVDIV